MRLYVDLNCFNRPFDDQGQERIRRETEAVFAVLRRIVEGTDTLVWSWALTFENDKHPKPDRRDEIALWGQRALTNVTLTPAVKNRSQEFSRRGIPAFDAIHLASAEIGEADVVLTCDDVLARRSRRLGLALRVLNPVAYLGEVQTNG